MLRMHNDDKEHFSPYSASRLVPSCASAYAAIAFIATERYSGYCIGTLQVHMYESFNWS